MPPGWWRVEAKSRRVDSTPPAASTYRCARIRTSLPLSVRAAKCSTLPPSGRQTISVHVRPLRSVSSGEHLSLAL